MNYALFFGFAVQLLIMIGAPIALALYWKSRHPMKWWHLAAGAITFGVTQIAFRMPIITIGQSLLAAFDLMTNKVIEHLWIIILVVSAGFVEEFGRYIAFRFITPKTRNWEQGVMFGIGHGGIESIWIGLTSMITMFTYFITSVFLNGSETFQAISQAYTTMPFYMPMVGGYERLMVIPFHIAMSVFVLRIVLSNRIAPVFIAVAIHSLLNYISLLLNMYFGLFATEGFLTVAMVSSVAYIFWASKNFPTPVIPETQKEVPETVEGATE